MGKADHYRHGAHNLISDRSGYKIKSTRARKEWTGAIVDKSEWEPRHPQDFLRAKVDRQAVPNPRTEATNSFLGLNEARNSLSDQADISTVTATAAAAGGNTGDGSVSSLSADLTADSSNTLTITRITTAAATSQDAGDNGAFRVQDSNGEIIGFGAVSEKFEGGGLSFTVLEDGSTDFAVGDKFTITVS